MNDIFRPAIQGILKCTEKAFNDLIKKVISFARVDINADTRRPPRYRK